MAEDFPSVWPVRCPRCARRVLIELPYGTAAGKTGVGECPGGHPFLFQYDGVTVAVPGDPARGAIGTAMARSPIEDNRARHRRGPAPPEDWRRW